MGKIIYGVDLSKEVTPVMLRDAIIRCFHEAHREALADLNRSGGFASEAERDGYERIQIGNIVRSAFEDVGADFDNPSKDDIIRAVGELSKFASRFRKPEIIKRHYDEIMVLVEKCCH